MSADLSTQLRNPALRALPIEIRVSVGRARLSITELLDLDPDAVLTLDRAIEDRVELFVGERLVAYGELTEIEEETKTRLGVRVIEVVESGDAT